MSPSFKFSILSPGGRAFEGPAGHVSAPGAMGGFGILPGHAPMIAAVRPGLCTVNAGGAEQHFYTGEGVLEVNREEVVLLVDEALATGTPDEARRQASERIKRSDSKGKD